MDHARPDLAQRTGPEGWVGPKCVCACKTEVEEVYLCVKVCVVGLGSRTYGEVVGMCR